MLEFDGQNPLAGSVASLRAPPPPRHLTSTLPSPPLLVTKPWDAFHSFNNLLHGRGRQISSGDTALSNGTFEL